MRKNPYVPESVTNPKYDPDVHSSSTIMAGSVIQQVCACMSAFLLCYLACFLLFGEAAWFSGVAQCGQIAGMP